MPIYKIKVAYDGTDFHGWQYQPDKQTIAGCLQDIFASVFKKNIALVGASRTDAGVHALGQRAHFFTDLNLDPIILKRAWNNRLPGSILLRSVDLVTQDFHAQRNVISKTYYYHLFQEKPLPILSRFGWWPKKQINIEKLQQCLNIFVGTHDFRSFCTGYDRESTIRTINSITLDYIARFKAYRIAITGHSFLRYMIRRIVGACVMVASSSRDINELEIALREKNPEQDLLTALPCGLMLYKIVYSNLANNFTHK